MFAGPSGDKSDASLIAPTKTTGLLLSKLKSRKYAPSAIVSVPCVTTAPLIEGSFNISSTFLLRLYHISGVICELSMSENCVTLIFAIFLSEGTA
uniref:Uncharacterized protein n=1 Tax=Candidatus Methanophaga sp. ANME-1 ERB7 TaxID=2759913 RepID=A0A7G9ZDC8_9EURY|nr:hypothetical protein DKLEMCON_00044 [Methanosarcinales archaeon ANME-1 ERB7]